MSNYRLRYLTPNEAPIRIKSLFEKNNNFKSLEKLNWQYKDLPSKKIYSCFAISNANEDAASYNLFAVEAKINGETEKIVCQSLDTLTDINHRGHGLFPKLAKNVFEKCDEEGISLVYGFPNSNSAPGFFDKLGWIDKSYPPFLIAPINLLFPLKYLNQKINFYVTNYLIKYFNKFNKENLEKLNLTISDEVNFDESYDDLWIKYSEKIDTCIWRGKEYMNWRYLKRPLGNYFFKSLYENGELKGIIIFAIESKHNGKIGYIMDIVYDRENLNYANLLIQSCINVMVTEKVDTILAWCNYDSCEYSIYIRNLFFKLPRKLQPIKLFFGYRVGKSLNTKVIKNFYITYSDSDTV